MNIAAQIINQSAQTAAFNANRLAGNYTGGGLRAVLIVLSLTTVVCGIVTVAIMVKERSSGRRG